MAANNRTYVLVLACASWLSTAVSGSALLWRYKYAPGTDALAPLAWPVASAIPRTLDRPTLIVFAHPRCACTRATLGELAQLMAHSQGRVSAHVVFFQPEGSAPDWARGALWDAAAAIPSARIHADAGGRQARLFRAQTSGHTVLYDAGGQRVFDGGITVARGHFGDNAGLRALTALVQGRAAELWPSKIFGCPILTRQGGAARGGRPCLP